MPIYRKRLYYVTLIVSIYLNVPAAEVRVASDVGVSYVRHKKNISPYLEYVYFFLNRLDSNPRLLETDWSIVTESRKVKKIIRFLNKYFSFLSV